MLLSLFLNRKESKLSGYGEIWTLMQARGTQEKVKVFFTKELIQKVDEAAELTKIQIQKALRRLGEPDI